jgi:hypothetical protein
MKRKGGEIEFEVGFKIGVWKKGSSEIRNCKKYIKFWKSLLIKL